MTIPDKPGWYWIRDAEIVKGSQWVMCWLDVYPRRRITLYTPDNSQEVWHLEHDGDGDWYSSMTDSDKLATECRPLEWVRIEEPQGVTQTVDETTEVLSCGCTVSKGWRCQMHGQP